MLKETLKCTLRSFRAIMCYPHIRVYVFEVRDIMCLRKLMGWLCEPILDHEHLCQFNTIQDLNERRLRDAEVIACACANTNPKSILEIGTAEGQTTALMALNAPQATVYTVNIPPEEISKGGTLVTHAFTREQIGSYYRDRGIQNIRQVFANTKNWKPDFGPIDIAFIDGCHDSDFVFNDTRKVLECCKSGSIIMWHDFNPSLIVKYNWIAQVCRGVERLYSKGLLKGPIFHLQDSFVGLYRVPC